MCQGRDKVPFGSQSSRETGDLLFNDEVRSVSESQQSDKLHGVEEALSDT